MQIDKLKNYILFLELRYQQVDIENAKAINHRDIDGSLRTELIDKDLAEALRAINDSMARVAREARKRRRR